MVPVRDIKHAFHLLATCLYAGDGQVSFIQRNGLRFRVRTKELVISSGYRLENVRNMLKSLENWGYIYNINLLNKGEVRFTVNLPKYLTLHPGEVDTSETNNNWK